VHVDPTQPECGCAVGRRCHGDHCLPEWTEAEAAFTRLVELAPGVTVDDVAAVTDAPVRE
jgi:acyl CoA:acetate/3-ketoacid CoA transferase beta subunit